MSAPENGPSAAFGVMPGSVATPARSCGPEVRRFRSAVAFGLAMLVLTAIGQSTDARPSDDEVVLLTLWSEPETAEPLFSESFLRQIPIARLAEIVIGLVAKCGALEAVRETGHPGRYVLRTERCELPTTLTRNHRGEIVGLWFHPPTRRDASLEDVLAELERFDGTFSYAVVENGDLIAGHVPDQPLAVGSAFKLVVLAALHERIEAGEARWADVLTLSDRHKSLPSGRLQNYPAGSPLRSLIEFSFPTYRG